MQKNKMVRDMSFTEIFWRIVQGWRTIICCMVVLAILASGVGYFWSSTSIEQASNKVALSKEEELELEKAKMTPAEITEVEELANLNVQLENYRSYVNNSLLIKIDPYNAHMANIEYHVDTDYSFYFTGEFRPDYSSNIIGSYINYVNAGGLVSYIMDNNSMDIDGANLTELISIAPNNVSTISGENIFQIEILHNDAEKLGELVKVVKNGVENYQKEVNQKLGAHTLEMVSESQVKGVNEDLRVSQASKWNQVATMRIQMNSIENGLTSTQLRALQLQNNLNKNSPTNAQASQEVYLSNVQINKWHFVVGAILGFLVACTWILLKILLSARLLNSNEISKMYDLRILGELNSDGKKKRFGHKIDECIVKTKSRNKKQISQEQKVDNMVCNIGVTCQKQEIQSIYLTGSEFECIEPALIAKIVSGLEQMGIAVKSGTSIIYNAESLKSIVDLGSAVFIEKTGTSLYKEIADEVTLAKEQKINILGAIIVA